MTETLLQEESTRKLLSAETRSENINYTYLLENGELRLENELTTDLSNKFRDQDITIILYLPEGSTLYADKNTESFRYISSYYNDILKRGMEEQYMRVSDGKLICLDCKDDEEEEELDAPISITSDKVEVRVKKTMPDDKPSSIEVSIDDTDGVQIKSVGKNDN